MGLIKQWVLLGAFCFVAFQANASVVEQSPIGYWKIIDSATGKPKSIVRISLEADNTLKGKIIKLFSENVSRKTLCTSCVGENHNQPLLGMVIMKGLSEHASQWHSGQIINPDNGKVYQCSARIADNGRKLTVIGYKGIPLFGRSETWERVDLGE